MEETLTGQLLLASPALNDPNFARTVVLIGVHNQEGAMGVVLNRPSQVTIVFLAEFLDPAPAGLMVLGRIGFPAPETSMEELTRATARGRVFAGYAGWGEGQLDAELEQGDWIVDAAQPRDVFSENPAGLWGQVLTRKGGSYALLARMPTDVSVN